MIYSQTFGSGSNGNAYLLDDSSDQLLIEAGVKFDHVAAALGFDFSKIKGLLVSHEHGDHTKYIKDFMAKTTIPFYMSAGTAEALHLEPSYRVKILQPFAKTRIGSWIVTGFPVEHDAAEPFGFVADNDQGERLLYVTDTYYVKYHFDNVTHMLVEMNYADDIISKRDHEGEINHTLHDRILLSHFSLENSLAFISTNKSPKLQEVTLIHVSESNGDPERFKRVVQEVTGVPVYVAGR